VTFVNLDDLVDIFWRGLILLEDNSKKIGAVILENQTLNSLDYHSRLVLFFNSAWMVTFSPGKKSFGPL
jgi:hypothetical protein